MGRGNPTFHPRTALPQTDFEVMRRGAGAGRRTRRRPARRRSDVVIGARVSGDNHEREALADGFELRLSKAVLLLFSPARNFILWQRRQLVENRLGALSDHMLKDIAASRSEIPFVASRDGDWNRFR
ncbi:DUF1127 domain-containing protein [Rhizobium sp. NZLR3b]|uniref:DUF1127 domain-containing protein n=1 Tax=Rhizobium sp. NZLR3b TaxID=2731101 RepID=UPI002180C7A8|nr:DUF1127 domain-containing protein [Rhizobium sp. NZLR3b]